MATISIVNQKGGTGKTTTAVTLAHKLALDGHRTLLVDTDVQGHIAKSLGMSKGPGIYRLIQRHQELADDLMIVSGRENLDILPSDKTTEQAKLILGAMPFREQVLATQLGSLHDDYDVIIIDCAPSLDVLHVAALVASDWIVVPTKLDFLAMDGVNEVIRSLGGIKQANPSTAPGLLGILPTFFDRTTNETHEQLARLVDAFKGLVLPPIPVDTKLREAPAYGKTIWEYAPKTRSVVGFRNGSRKTVGGYARFVEIVLEKAGSQ